MSTAVLLVVTVVSTWSQTVPLVMGAHQQQSTTPVPILRQVNTLNDDGSYTYGFEAADGSFKLETRAADGQVSGKYGYVDANGRRQVFQYDADKSAGFKPSSSLLPRAPLSPPASADHIQPATQHQATLGTNNDNYRLTGFSEDRDEDGFVDPLPASLKSPRTNPSASFSVQIAKFANSARFNTPVNTAGPTAVGRSLQTKLKPQPIFPRFSTSAPVSNPVSTSGAGTDSGAAPIFDASRHGSSSFVHSAPLISQQPLQQGQQEDLGRRRHLLALQKLATQRQVVSQQQQRVRQEAARLASLNFFPAA